MQHTQAPQPDDALDAAIQAMNRTETPPPPGDSFNDAILRRARGEADAADPEARWRLPRIPAARFWSLAAALAVVASAAVALLYTPQDHRAVFAQVLQRVARIDAVAFTTHADLPGQDKTVTTRTIVKNPGLLRQEFPDQRTVNIFDFTAMQGLTLLEEPRFAQRIDMTAMPADERPTDFVAEYRKLSPENAQYLRRETLDGRPTLVYRVTHGVLGGEAWIDLETRLPVRIRVVMDHQAGQPASEAVLTDFDWNPRIDAGLFSVEPPAGYTVHRMKPDGPSEADFITLLRVWAALSGEPFPDQMRPATVVLIGQMMYDPSEPPEQMTARLRRQLTPVLGEAALAPERMQDSLFGLGRTIMQGGMFLGQLEAAGWTWVGGGVEPGDPDAPLYYWQPPGSEAYHVVYGDFTLRQLPANEVPRMDP